MMAQVRILIVEDERIVARDLEDGLKALGYAVSGVASSGEDGVLQAAKTRPDLVLMDIRLRGEVDGVEAAGQIRTQFDIPVVYLTAYADDETFGRAKVTHPLATSSSHSRRGSCVLRSKWHSTSTSWRNG
jgi:CheY-like chemotaxis protein